MKEGVVRIKEDIVRSIMPIGCLLTLVLLVTFSEDKQGKSTHCGS